MTHVNNIEEDLKRALRRQDPPPDLASKIMGRVASGEGLEPDRGRGQNNVFTFRPKHKVLVWLAAAAAAACLVGLFVTRGYLAERGKTAASAPVAKETGGNAPPADQIVVSGKPGPDKAGPAWTGGPGPGHHSTGLYHKRIASHPSEEARRAEEQLRLALSITSATLGYAQRSLEEVNGTSDSSRDLNR
jgi:hypothetical protein